MKSYLICQFPYLSHHNENEDRDEEAEVSSFLLLPALTSISTDLDSVIEKVKTLETDFREFIECHELRGEPQRLC